MGSAQTTLSLESRAPTRHTDIDVQIDVVQHLAIFRMNNLQLEKT